MHEVRISKLRKNVTQVTAKSIDINIKSVFNTDINSSFNIIFELDHTFFRNKASRLSVSAATSISFQTGAHLKYNRRG